MIETFVPTSWVQYATATNTFTTTVVGPSSSPLTVVVGPSGIGWIPYNEPLSATQLSAPTELPLSLVGTIATSQDGQK